MDGGTFVAKCGNNTPDTGFPPRVVISCHSGLSAPPLGGNAYVQVLGSMAFPQVIAILPQPPMVTGADPTVHIIPDPAPFESPMMPFDTTGWMALVGSMPEPNGTVATNIAFNQTTDVLGTQLCPAPPVNPMHPGPALLARITGATSGGPFESEVFLRFCGRGM
jgi:hypothetical protein